MLSPHNFFLEILLNFLPMSAMLLFARYKSRGLSFNFPVAGSSKPKDSKTTTPIKTLSIISEIQTLKILSTLEFYPCSSLFSLLHFMLYL